MPTNYLLRFALLFFLIAIFQNVKALNPSFEEKIRVEKTQLKISNKKNNSQNQLKSTKKAVFKPKSTKSKTKKEKYSLQKKLSILKFVLKNKPHNFDKVALKKSTNWNGQHTAGLLSWASVLVAIMAFFTGHFLLGILAVCSAILFLLLIFVEKGSKGIVDDVLWVFSQIINVIVILATIFD